MSVATYRPVERRPLASRDLGIMQLAAQWLVARGVSANAISLASIGFATFASLALAATAWTDDVIARTLFLAAAACVQLRLLANLLDGMVAVSCGRASRIGELYNEVPDRVADALILIGAGFSAGGTPTLGYLAALMAVFVAYLRAFGGSVGATGLFIGPMTKPQRMATVTAACICGACAPGFAATAVALGLIVVGGAITAVRRLQCLAVQLGETK